VRILFCGNSSPTRRNICANISIRAPVTRSSSAGRRQQWGAGLEGVDVDAAKRKGVFVANVPATGGNAEAVAEHAMLLTCCFQNYLGSSAHLVILLNCTQSR
jgi:phosphoglycerate dehydrogenase-like enzyme